MLQEISGRSLDTSARSKCPLLLGGPLKQKVAYPQVVKAIGVVRVPFQVLLRQKEVSFHLLLHLLRRQSVAEVVDEKRGDRDLCPDSRKRRFDPFVDFIFKKEFAADFGKAECSK